MMNPKYNHVQWVVQRNLTSQADFSNLKEACLNLGAHFIEVDIIPFTVELPVFDRSRHSIIYGSTTFNALALLDKDLRKGLFLNEQAFTMENYMEQWGPYMLNHGAMVTTFHELINDDTINGNKELFIRPNDDNKSFAGEVKRFDEIGEWYNRLSVVENMHLSLESKIIVSEPYRIQYEWRLWVVNKKVIAASKYREYFMLKKEEGCPVEVIAFAEDRCQQYTPYDVFVMDVCLCGDSYFIVECGCMNGTGFYYANIAAIVSGVTDYFASVV